MSNDSGGDMWGSPDDVPLDVLRPLVLEVAKECNVRGRDKFCLQQSQCCVRLKQRLGFRAGHFCIETLSQVIMRHGKKGLLAFSESANHGARSYIDREAGQSTEYKDWLRSDDFLGLARQCKRNAGSRCVICNAAERPGNPLEAHHRSYARMKTPGEIKDLTCLCRRCHRAFHDSIKDLPADELF